MTRTNFGADLCRHLASLGKQQCLKCWMKSSPWCLLSVICIIYTLFIDIRLLSWKIIVAVYFRWPGCSMSLVWRLPWTGLVIMEVHCDHHYSHWLLSNWPRSRPYSRHQGSSHEWFLDSGEGKMLHFAVITRRIGKSFIQYIWYV